LDGGAKVHRNGDDILGDMVLGAIAGAAGVWVMDRIDWFNYRHEDPEARRQTQQVRPGGEDPAHVIAQRAQGMTGAELSPSQHHAAGTAIHYAIGIGPAAIYGAMKGRVPGVGADRGLLYGLGLFLIQDELANAAAGFSADPRRYPWQAHARGLVAHLVYGVVTDTVWNTLKGATSRNLRARAQGVWH
jgi:hypothetical protein